MLPYLRDTLRSIAAGKTALFCPTTENSTMQKPSLLKRESCVLPALSPVGAFCPEGGGTSE